MIGHYFTIAFRTLAKAKLYSLINIFGLAVGVASCTIIGIYVYGELQFDRHSINADRLFRIQIDNWACVPYAIGPHVARNSPEVENYVRFSKLGRTVVTSGENHFIENRGYYVDSTVFEMMTYLLLHGDPSTKNI